MYGVPLDSRGDLSKVDWMSCAAAFASKSADAEQLLHYLYVFANTTETRVPSQTSMTRRQIDRLDSRRDRYRYRSTNIGWTVGTSTHAAAATEEEGEGDRDFGGSGGAFVEAHIVVCAFCTFIRSSLVSRRAGDAVLRLLVGWSGSSYSYCMVWSKRLYVSRLCEFDDCVRLLLFCLSLSVGDKSARAQREEALSGANASCNSAGTTSNNSMVSG